MRYTSFLPLFGIVLPNLAQAQDAVDIGNLKATDIRVVQKILYTKTGKTEYGGHLGVMPFDAYTLTPKIELSYGKHLTEMLMWEAGLGLGYGFKNGTFNELEGPSYGITPDAYRYLSSVHASVQYSPIYAKMSWDGTKVFHHDIYAIAGANLTVEQTFMEDGDISVAPGISIGAGARVFLPNGNALRFQIRDDILFQSRAKTAEVQGFYLKQNAVLSVGYVFFQGK